MLMCNISFKADIQLDKAKIMDFCKSDKFFVKDGYKKNLETVVTRVQELSGMQEKSKVVVYPRLNNNQLNLICRVNDNSNVVGTIINERSARKISADSTFAERFVFNISKAIKNVEITQKSISRIDSFLKELANVDDCCALKIQNEGSWFGRNVGFVDNLPKFILRSLDKGFNPTDRIMFILKKISIEFPNENNIISIKNYNSSTDMNKQSRINTYFCVQNSFGEKRIPIHLLMRDPIDNLFV